MYFTRRGNIVRARRLLDGIRLVQACDPLADGRTRTSYRADDLIDPSCQPRFDDPTPGTGNMAWQGIALTEFFRVTGEMGTPLPPLLPVVAEDSVRQMAFAFAGIMVLMQIVVIANALSWRSFTVLRGRGE